MHDCLPGRIAHLILSLFHFKEWPINGGPPVDALLATMGEIEKCQAGIMRNHVLSCAIT